MILSVFLRRRTGILGGCGFTLGNTRRTGQGRMKGPQSGAENDAEVNLEHWNREGRRARPFSC